MKKSSEIPIALTAILVCWARLSDSVVYPDFDRFRRACPSPKVNAWKVINHDVCYLATPVHVTINSPREKRKKKFIMHKSVGTLLQVN